MTHQAHALTLEDRGEGHIHRFIPCCACGYRGPFGKRSTAERYYAEHVRDAAAVVARRNKGRARRSGGSGPRPLTPADKLPEAWR